MINKAINTLKEEMLKINVKELLTEESKKKLKEIRKILEFFDTLNLYITEPMNRRQKFMIVRDIIKTTNRLQELLNIPNSKCIEVVEIERRLNGVLTLAEIDDAIKALITNGDIFRPKQGFIQVL